MSIKKKLAYASKLADEDKSTIKQSVAYGAKVSGVSFAKALNALITSLEKKHGLKLSLEVDRNS